MRRVSPIGVIVCAFIFCFANQWMQTGSARADQTQEYKKECQACHAEQLNAWDLADVQHFPYKAGKCRSCHAAEHKQFNSELTQTCQVCHDLNSEKIKKAHFSANISGVDCLKCHYTHASDQKGLLKEVTHQPFGLKMCGACHVVDEAGKIKVQDNIEKVCKACHSDKTGKGMAVAHPALEMLGCPDCHNPHTTSRPRLLSRNMTDLCLDCHDQSQIEKHPVDIEPSAKAAVNPGKPWLILDGKVTCASCHNPHFAEIPFLLKETTVDGKLCADCHTK